MGPKNWIILYGAAWLASLPSLAVWATRAFILKAADLPVLVALNSTSALFPFVLGAVVFWLSKKQAAEQRRRRAIASTLITGALMLLLIQFGR